MTWKKILLVVAVLVVCVGAGAGGFWGASAWSAKRAHDELDHQNFHIMQSYLVKLAEAAGKVPKTPVPTPTPTPEVGPVKK